MTRLLLVLGISLLFSSTISCTKKHTKVNFRPQNFVDIKEVIPEIALDIRYVTRFNFVGEPIDGYLEPKCLLTLKTAAALKRVQIELLENKLSLKIYDCYRPQTAVNHFVRWAKALENITMKKIFYPRVDKKDLFKQGYIAAQSSHSRGSTADLTIVPVPILQQNSPTSGRPFSDNSILMGTPFDFFDPLSHTENPQIIGEYRNNRQLLRTVMEKHGFKNLQEEWWHYTLKLEPYPDTYFNFPVE